MNSEQFSVDVSLSTIIGGLYATNTKTEVTQPWIPGGKAIATKESQRVISSPFSPLSPLPAFPPYSSPLPPYT